MKILLAMFFLSVAPVLLHGQRVLLGSTAPKGSYWHDVLLQVSQDWRAASGGKISVVIFPDGVQGSESEMLRKMQIGQLQAVALSGATLPLADRGVQCLAIPLFYASYEELDYVFERVRGKLEQQLLAKGYVVLLWSDAGWVHFFSKKPARRPAEMKQFKLFTSAGDPETEKLWKDFGFQPIPTAPRELTSNLMTGLLDAFDVPPLFALANQSFGQANHMLNLKWSPLMAGTLIRKDVWERFPPELREKLMGMARASGQTAKSRIRKLGDEAVVEMKKKGLVVVEPAPADVAAWRAETEAAYSKIRGTVVPAEMFDDVVRYRDEYRKSQRVGR